MKVNSNSFHTEPYFKIAKVKAHLIQFVKVIFILELAHKVENYIKTIVHINKKNVRDLISVAAVQLLCTR